MVKKLKVYGFIFLIALLSTVSIGINAESNIGNTVNMVLDTLDYMASLPKNFRKTTDLSFTKDDRNLNLNGLNELNISGGEQFSEYNLPNLINTIGTPLPITVVDLRQESHGFINGLPVSWVDSKNHANEGLTKKQVLLDERTRLQNIKLNFPISFYNHPQITIVPTKVQDEKDLVTSKGLSYYRITVTDGRIPDDDMVDYFIKLVNSHDKNSWLYFHCKAGIGRTTTFMIMYDMMKNYKEVSDDAIINRQIALAKFNNNTIKSFYTPERISFLKTFYQYCKSNGDAFDVNWSQWKNIKSTETKSVGYIKNSVVPSSLYVIDLDSLSSSERTMIASLQGLVNGHCSFQIYTVNSSQPDYKIWLEDLKNNYKISYKVISDPFQLLNVYKSYIKGYVIYSGKSVKDPSINNACSFASLNKAIVVDETLEAKVRNYGIKKILADCRGTDESWAYNNLWNKGLNHSIVIQLPPNRAAPLRDYAIMSKSLVFYEDNINNTSLRDKIFSSMENNPICLGWGPDEFINVSTASKHGVSVVAADWSYNLTTLSAFPSPPILKKSLSGIPKEQNVHYVTFIMSDGDNQQWNLGTNYGSTKWFGYSNRDNLSLGWSMTPSLYYLAPTVFKLYYQSISNEKVNNNFVVSPSGNGYIYPSKFPKDKLNSYINILDDYMKMVNQKYVSIIDDSSLNNSELWNRFTEKSNIEGLFYLYYKRHDEFKGRILWSNNKPVVACRDVLWEGLENENELIKNIHNRINSGQVNINNSDAYTFVYVHVWSKDCKSVQYVIDELKQIPNVRIVPPEMFMELIKSNVKH